MGFGKNSNLHMALLQDVSSLGTSTGVTSNLSKGTSPISFIKGHVVHFHFHVVTQIFTCQGIVFVSRNAVREKAILPVLDPLPRARSRALGKDDSLPRAALGKANTRQNSSLPRVQPSANNNTRQRISLPSVALGKEDPR